LKNKTTVELELNKDKRKQTKAVELEDIRDQKVSVEQDNGLQDMTVSVCPCSA
jgi:Tfp pilus assembly protein PilO